MTTKTYSRAACDVRGRPARGGGSLTVYRIAVDRKTAYVVQTLDYNRPQSAAAKRAADSVHQALLKARR